MRILSAVVVALGLAISGCGGTGNDDRAAGSGRSDQSRAPSEAPSPSASPSGPPPNTGAKALHVGQTRHGSGRLATTLLKVEQPATSPSSVKPDHKGDEWITAKVRVCTPRNATQELAVDVLNFVGVDSGGGRHDVSDTTSRKWPPTPQFPEQQNVIPGTCLAGWVLFEVAKGVRFDRIALMSQPQGGSVVAEWII
jgi:hypothetical protein